MSESSAPPRKVVAPGQSYATAGYVAPLVAYVAIMAVERALGLPLLWSYAVRLGVASLLVFRFSMPFLSFRPSAPAASIAIGIAVFLIWIGPDLLFGYRHYWLFDNPVTGSAVSSSAPLLRHNLFLQAIRMLGTSLLVPVVEELFWRGWLMRWLIDKNFLAVPLGTYVPSVFWIVAVLFASEHGPYWEVGLAAGVIYNWWIIRTRNLADCILAHLVTNAILGVYVIAAGQWQYWL